MPYKLVVHARDPVTHLAPPELKALHPIGSAPVVTDGAGDAGGIGGHRRLYSGPLRRGAACLYGRKAPEFADYLYWLHFGNGTLQPTVGRLFMLGRLKNRRRRSVCGRAFTPSWRAA